MTGGPGTPPLAAPLFPIPLLSRFYGFGSIYGKTVRDSRLAFLVAAGVRAGMMLAAGAAMQDVFPTAQSRAEVDKLIDSIPASMSGLFGNPVKVGTLPGVVNWKYGPFFALGAGRGWACGGGSGGAGQGGRRRASAPPPWVPRSRPRPPSASRCGSAC